MESQTELTDIQRFYRDSTVFLTGATGFIGKLYLEKILRSLPVNKVYILVRNKHHVSSEKRVEKIFESKVFDLLKRTNPEALHKVKIIPGDLQLRDLGVSAPDRDLLVKEVNVIVHCAAITRFDAKLKTATFINIRCLRDMINLAKKIPVLKSFTVIGTAYSNCNKTEVKENIYSATITAERLISVCEILDDDIVEYMTEKIIQGWPNSYTFTKQVAEDLIQRECQNLPVYIARPTIVVSTANEPISAFVDNFYTLAGFVVLMGVGLIRITYYKRIILDIIPADFVVNQCIAAGWQTGEDFRMNQRTGIPVYNICSGRDNPISQDDVYTYADYFGRKVPSLRQPVYPLYFRTTCKYNYLFWRFFMHTLLAHTLDFVARLTGKPQRFVSGVNRIHKFQALYEYFTTKEFFYHVENTHILLKKMSFQDKELFRFDITTVNWKDYFANYPKGLRVYLMEDNLDTLPKAKIRFQKLKIYFFVILGILMVFWYFLLKFCFFRALPFFVNIFINLLKLVVCKF